MSFSFRKTRFEDIPFLVETIIEAEKSGTSILSYSTIFGLSEEDTYYYISKMLEEEVDGCELSISSFIIAEEQGKIAGAIAVWLEGSEGISSTILKGNLLNFTLPKFSLEAALKKAPIIKEIHIEYTNHTLQLGLVYVLNNYRGRNLAGEMIEFAISDFNSKYPDIKEMHVQVFGNNTSAIKAYKKVGFEISKSKESINPEINSLLPYSSKVLMIKIL